MLLNMSLSLDNLLICCSRQVELDRVHMQKRIIMVYIAYDYDYDKYRKSQVVTSERPKPVKHSFFDIDRTGYGVS